MGLITLIDYTKTNFIFVNKFKSAARDNLVYCGVVKSAKIYINKF
ncbi:hypothetical protein Emin_0323 [Elusimicrobium minutum Pei191]|uniref:Uncharacterized protein n=1 Tax=Elusimicrobium minutum (strain Pei191) TaxID=445932 RepID=B2KBX8_ELUMP|nr:hypothetical protein Emin_0323 [Elusimicrobium minutum Pei191]